MAGALFLGLDVGTQGTKGLIVDRESTRVVARAAEPYDLIAGLPPGAAEQHPNTWIEAIRTVVGRLGEQLDLTRLAGVGVSGQQHGFVALDGYGEVIRPAKLWCDTSTADEARFLSEQLGRHVPVGFTASKILWLKNAEPQNFAALRQILLPHDYVNLRLTGRVTMECGDASGSGLFNPHTRRFDDGALAAIDPNLRTLLPPLIEAGSEAGRVDARGARDFGLPEGLPVATGGGDNMLSAIGAGATRDGVVVASLGTSGTVFTRTDRAVVDPEGLIAPFCDSTGGWLPLLCVMNLTGVTEEVRTVFGGRSHAELTAAAEAVPVGCEGLTFLPYLAGERVPDLPAATGTLLGLRPGLMTPGHLYRAALEGTSLNLAWGVDRLRQLGIAVDSVRLVGGAAGNRLWRQILADAFNAPVSALRESESAALGGALQALWTVARTEDPEASIDAIAQPFVEVDGQALDPSAETAAAYAALGQAFRERVASLY